MTDENNPDIYIEYSADAFPPTNWTDLKTYALEFNAKNSGTLKTPECELKLRNTDGRYTGNGALTLGYYKFIRIRADVRGTIDTLFFGRLSKINSTIKKKIETLTVTAKDEVIDRLLCDFITKKYNSEYREGATVRTMKDCIDDLLATPDSGASTGITLTTDSGAITTTNAAYDFDRDVLLDAVKKISAYVGYAGYGEVSGANRNLFLYPYGWQATSPAITITDPLEREFDKGLDEVYNQIFVWANVAGAFPNRDFQTEGGVAAGFWTPINGECTVSDDTGTVKVNSKSVKIHKAAGSQTIIGASVTNAPLVLADVTFTKLTHLSFAIHSSYGSEYIAIVMEDTQGRHITWSTGLSLASRKYADGWCFFDIPLGGIFRSQLYSNQYLENTDHTDRWVTPDIAFNWIIRKITFGSLYVPANQAVDWYIDGLHFVTPMSTNPLLDPTLQAIDNTSIATYGRRVLFYDSPDIKYGDLMKSLADKILSITKNPVPKLTVTQGAKTWIKPNQYITVTVPQYGINNEQWRIVEFEHDWATKTKLLRTTMKLAPRTQPLTDREWFAGLIEGILKNMSW